MRDRVSGEGEEERDCERLSETETETVRDGVSEEGEGESERGRQTDGDRQTDRVRQSWYQLSSYINKK